MSFGGAVEVTITAQDELSCHKLRKVILQQFGGEANINGTVTKCQQKNVGIER